MAKKTKTKPKRRPTSKKKTASKPKSSSGDSLVARLAAAARKSMKGEEEAVYFGNDSSMGEPRSFVSSNIAELDEILDDQARGWPMGRIIEIFGDSGTGKSGVGCAFGSQVQKAGGVFVVFLAEGEYSDRLARLYDVCPERVVLIDTNIVEDVFKTIYAMLDEAVDDPTPMLFMLDSVAGLCTREEFDDPEFDRDRQAQIRAQVISKSLRKVGAKIPRTNATLFLINQVNEGDTTPHGFKGKAKPPGGKRIGFYSTIRLRLESIGKIRRQKNKKKLVRGFQVKITTEKNRLADPFQSIELNIDFDNGISVKQGSGAAKQGMAPDVTDFEDDGLID